MDARSVTKAHYRAAEALIGLALALVVLRLCGVLSVSWLWAFAPVWIPVAAANVFGFLEGLAKALKGGRP